MPASLRSDGVRVHPGMPFGFPSELAFGFAGILKWRSFSVLKTNNAAPSPQRPGRRSSIGTIQTVGTLEN
jgi:hypothetical protein